MFEIGGYLREARLRQGLSLDRCEADTRIRARYLGALEDEAWSALPEPVFVRGFLRTYAAYLGLDPELALQEYRFRVVPDDVPDDAEAPGREPVPAPRGERVVAERVLGDGRGRRGRALAWAVGGGLLLLGAVVWLAPGGGGDDPAPPPGAAAPQAAPPPAPPPAATPPAAGPRPAPPAGVTLAVQATGSGSYLLVRARAGGPALFEGILAGGQRRRWHAARGLWIRVGWTPALRATVNGRRVTLRGGTASFVVGRRGVAPAT